MRLDRYLCLNGYCSSRERAKKLIENSLVKVGGRIVTKPAFEVTDEKVETLSDGIKYVSRGGLKLEKAIVEIRPFFEDYVKKVMKE